MAFKDLTIDSDNVEPVVVVPEEVVVVPEEVIIPEEVIVPDEVVVVPDETEILPESVFDVIPETTVIKPESLGIKDWKATAKFLDIDIDENTPESLKSGYQKMLETQKQTVDLSKYSESSKTIIEHLNAGGDITDFIDPLLPINKALSLTPEEKATIALKSEGVKPEKISARIEMMKENDEFKEYVEEIDNDLVELRETKIKETVVKINSLKQEQQKNITGTNQREKEELIATLKNATTFMGLPVSETVKSGILTQISDGTFHKELDNAESMIQAFLYKKFGTKMDDYYKAKEASARRAGFNEGLLKGKEGVHDSNIQDPSRGHNASNGTAKGFGKLKGEVGDQ